MANDKKETEKKVMIPVDWEKDGMTEVSLEAVKKGGMIIITKKGTPPKK